MSSPDFNPYEAPAEAVVPVELEALKPIPCVPAPLWRRFLAGLVDLGIAYGCAVLGAAVVSSSVILIATVFDLKTFGANPGPWEAFLFTVVMLGFVIAIFGPMFAYYVLMESSRSQATLGKSWLGLAVTGIDGRRITRRRSLFRTLAKAMGIGSFGIGLLSIFFNRHAQAFHDRVANTVVILRDDREPA